ncbi:MAG TPA: CBS domain-containing protein [Terriglobales bacterium]|nr:CBS domain-containing protein [Terriglobales bacterium]
MSRVAEILAYKGRDVHTIDQEATVFAAVERLVEKNVGALVVTDEGATVGIFTERDFLRRVALRQRDPRTTRVREVMTDRLICADPNRSIEDCMVMMTQERIRHLPVIEGARLAGMVSIGDLVKHVSDERHVEIRYLTDYITGKYPG